jgi:hypothetical protein
MNSFTKVYCIQCKEYYGSQERQGMCSVCFKKYQNTKDLVPEKVESTKKEEEKDNQMINIDNEIKIEEQQQPSKPIQSNPFNCYKCDKKVGYSGFKCNCGYVFCGAHRHFSEHNCDFDYKSYDREKLIKKNAMGEAKKVK